MLVFPRVIVTQQDLAEVYVLRQELKQIQELHQQKRAWIRYQLSVGASVEPGPRRARMVECYRYGQAEIPTVFTMLLLD